MIFSETESVCPVCLRKLPAILRTAPDGVYMDKSCPEHGSFTALLWEGDFESYLAWSSGNIAREVPIDAKAPEKGCPYDCGLCAAHQTKGCCVLLEVTGRCNLRCPVCFAAAGEGDPVSGTQPEGKEEDGSQALKKKDAQDLPMEEIRQQYEYLMSHGGPFNIQLSGGEPTMRDDLPEIIRLGKSLGFPFFQLNTNGRRLAREEGYAALLKEAGLDTVFLQFDGVTDDVYEILRGRPLLSEKKQAIRNCADAGLGIVLVPVIAAGVNEHQAGDLIRFALQHMPAVRGVHFQPLSYFGRCALPRPEKPVTIPKMLHLLESQTDGLLHAADFSGGGAENPYCSFHASYRLRPDGSLKSLNKQRPAGQSCCCRSDDARRQVAEKWSGKTEEFCEDGELMSTSSLDAFLEEARLSTFSVSGMVFQDAWNLDLARLRRCYICEMDSRWGMVPFCAYNLTDTKGRSLYRH